jgi:RNA-directed DNA polymerase
MYYKKIKKDGWFIGRGYRHFDYPRGFRTTQEIVTSSNKVKDHIFWPLLSYKKLERRFKGFKSDGTSYVRQKSRLICYAAHLDAQIYAYYACNLESRYATLRKELDIDDCVLAYRQGKGCNIDMANTAFEEIKKRHSCIVYAMDIKGFFDNIYHLILKKQYCRVLGTDVLPDDHYNLFKSITRFSRVDLAACLTALDLKSEHLKKSTKPLCSPDDFHKKIKGKGEGYKNLIITNSGGRNEDNSLNWKAYGIPQGTPISTVLSNIAMIDFDISINNYIKSMGGMYWRYSDDIMIICPPECEAFIEQEIDRNLSEQGGTLKINKGKTEAAKFQNENNKVICQVKNNDGTWAKGSVQYLGLCFNGVKKTLRHSTIARYQRKMKYAVRNAGRTAKYFKKDKIRSKSLYWKLTDIGLQSMPNYAAKVSKITGDPTAKKQVNSHKKMLKNLILEENKKL